MEIALSFHLVRETSNLPILNFLFQDPNKPVIRLYKLPEGTFSSDEEEETDEETTDEDESGED